LLKDADGTGTYVQVGPDLPASARATDFDVVLTQENWSSARYVIDACNAAGCTRSNAMDTLNLSAALIGYLKAPDTRANDNFGHATALSADGTTLAVSSPYALSGSGPVAGGAVYVYARSDNAWTFVTKLAASNAEDSDSFGTALAISADGDTLVVGAPSEDSGGNNPADNTASSAGAAYVFDRANGLWAQGAYLKAADAYQYDYFGSAVAMSPDGATIAVGSPYKSTLVPAPGTSLYSRGAAYVFTRSSNTWTHRQSLTAPIPASGAYYGQSLALSNDGTVLAIGAHGEAVGAATYAGRAYLYSRGNNTWSFQSVLTATTPASSAGFGNVLAMSTNGRVLVIAAPTEELPGQPDPLWGAGAVYVFDVAGNAATLRERLTAATPDAGDRLGAALAISGDGRTIVATAPYESGDALGLDGTPSTLQPAAGAAYLFAQSAQGFRQRSYVKASNTQAQDLFGTAVALDHDGHTLVVTAPSEQSAATGLNGNQTDDCNAVRSNCEFRSGAVYVY
jgi:hypothetical protein